jgi:hypothetical protein
MSAMKVAFVERIEHIDRRAWAACFPGEVENYEYHCAVEHVGLEGFEFGWYVAHRDALIVCAVPVFFTTYDLTTTAEGRTQRWARTVQPWVPGQLHLKLSCLGSPVTERFQLGLHPDLDADEAAEVLSIVLSFWAEHAAWRGIGLLGVKDVSDRDRAMLGAKLEAFALKPVLGLPTANVRVGFSNEAQYLSSLSSATRKDLRRKLKRRADVRIEVRNDPGPYLAQVAAMYAETRERSDWTFENLPAAYFEEVLRRMGEGALLVLYFHEGELLAANLLLLGETDLVDKFFVMRGDAGRKLNLYFLSWLQNIELCIEKGLSSYVCGQGAAETKLRLGSHLSRSWIYFKHQNPILNLALGAISGLLAVQQPDERGADARTAANTQAAAPGRTYVLWLIFVSLETGAQLALKEASNAGTAGWLNSIGPIVNNPWFLGSIACDAANLLVWLAILRRHELSVAVPLSSMTYFAVLLASALLLHEPVRGFQLAGLFLVGIGVPLVSWNETSHEEGDRDPSDARVADRG